MAFNNTDLDNSFKSIEIDGFIINKEIMGYSWTQWYEDRSNRIIIGYGGYPDAYRIYTPTADIYFDEVENYLSPFYKKHNIQETSQSTIRKVFQDLKDVNCTILETKIKDDESFNTVKREIQKIINEGALPFIKKYSSLKSVSELLAFKSAEEIVTYIQGAKLLPKTVLILKLSGHPQFKEKLIEFYGILKQYAQKKSIYLSYLNLFNELFAEDLKDFK